jgi:hypothetical protein
MYQDSNFGSDFYAKTTSNISWLTCKHPAKMLEKFSLVSLGRILQC